MLGLTSLFGGQFISLDNDRTQPQREETPIVGRRITINSSPEIGTMAKNEFNDLQSHLAVKSSGSYNRYQTLSDPPNNLAENASPVCIRKRLASLENSTSMSSIIPQSAESKLSFLSLNRSNRYLSKARSNQNKSDDHSYCSETVSKGTYHDGASIPLLNGKNRTSLSATDSISEISGNAIADNYDLKKVPLSTIENGSTNIQIKKNVNTSLSSADSVMSHGSTAAGDSFILPLDWHQDYVQDSTGVAMFDDNPMNCCFDDPYIPKMKSKVSLPWTPPGVTDTGNTKNDNFSQVQQSTTNIRARIPTKSSKSLGSFSFPINDNFSSFFADDLNNDVVLVPKNSQIPKSYEPANDDSGIAGTVSSDGNEEPSCTSKSSPHAGASIRFDNRTYCNVELADEENVKFNSRLLTPKTKREKALSMSNYYKSLLGRVYDDAMSDFSQHGVRNKIKHSFPLGCKFIAEEGQEFFEVAGLWMDIGLSEVLAEDFESAVQSFLQAACVYRDIGKAVATAKALDRAGVAYCRALKHQDSMARKLGSNETILDPPVYCVPAGMKASGAMQCLRDSLTIRQNELGPWHIDTVDTLNHMANLYLLSGNAAQAAVLCEQVFYLRQAIFGPLHPAVGVAAHEVANATLQSNTMSSEQARHWYQLASDIYQALNLSIKNPSVQHLLKDVRRMERVDLWRQQTSGNLYDI